MDRLPCRITSLIAIGHFVKLNDWVYDSVGDLWQVESQKTGGDCLFNGAWHSQSELIKVVRPMSAEQIVAFARVGHYYVERYKCGDRALEMLRQDLQHCCSLIYTDLDWKKLCKDEALSADGLVRKLVKV